MASRMNVSDRTHHRESIPPIINQPFSLMQSYRSLNKQGPTSYPPFLTSFFKSIQFFHPKSSSIQLCSFNYFGSDSLRRTSSFFRRRIIIKVYTNVAILKARMIYGMSQIRAYILHACRVPKRGILRRQLRQYISQHSHGYFHGSVCFKADAFQPIDKSI